MENDKIAIEKANQKLIIEKEQATKSVKLKCKICTKYLYEQPKCPGHDDDDSSDNSPDAPTEDADNHKGNTLTKILNLLNIVENFRKDEDKVPSKIPNHVYAVEEIANDNDNLDFSQQLQLNEGILNLEIISEMLSKRLLMIDNNGKQGILTIKLLCKPDVLSQEQKNELTKFVDIIVKQLKMFKKENGISTRCKTIDRDNKGNILSVRIMLPTSELYDAFIRRLANQNLLPIQNIQQSESEKVLYEAGVNHFNLTPLSTNIRPSANTRVQSIESEEIDKTENQTLSAIAPNCSQMN